MFWCASVKSTVHMKCYLQLGIIIELCKYGVMAEGESLLRNPMHGSTLRGSRAIRRTLDINNAGMTLENMAMLIT